MVSPLSWILTFLLVSYGLLLLVCHWLLFNSIECIVTLFIGVGIFICAILFVTICRILFFPVSTFRRIRSQIHVFRRKLARKKAFKFKNFQDFEVQRITIDDAEDRRELPERKENSRKFDSNRFFLDETISSTENFFELREIGVSKETLSGKSNCSGFTKKNKHNGGLIYAEPSVNILANATSFISSDANLHEESTEDNLYVGGFVPKSCKNKKIKSSEFSGHGSMYFSFIGDYISVGESRLNFDEEGSIFSKKLNTIRSRVIHMYDRYFLRGLTAFFSKDFVQVSLFLINIIWALLWGLDSSYLTRESFEDPWKVRKGVETLLLFEEAFLWIADISLLYKILEEISVLSRGINGIITLKYLITSTTFIPLLEMLTTSPILLLMKYSIGSGSVTTFFMMGFLRYFRILNPVPILSILLSWSSEVMRICIVIIWTIACVVLGFSGAMMIIESPKPKFTTLFDYFYYTIITISTVGYGDYTPSNFVSRLICIILIIFTIIYVPNQISKLVQLAQTPPETMGICNIGVYDESIFERDHIHTTLVLVIGSPSVKHLSYLLMELNQLNVNIDYIKQFNGKSGKIIRYQPIVMLLTNSDPRDYSVLVKKSQQALHTQLFVKKIKSIESLKEDIDSIKGFIYAIYFWSDAINAKVCLSENIAHEDNNSQGTKSTRFPNSNIGQGVDTKLFSADQVLDLERNTMMIWYAVRKFLDLKEYELLYRSKETGLLYNSSSSILGKKNRRNSENKVDGYPDPLYINSVIIFNGENSDFKLDNVLRDDHFYDLHGIQDINTARRNVITNNPNLQAPKNPEEISSYLFYLSKVSGSDHQSNMKRITNMVRDRLSIEFNNKQNSFSINPKSAIDEQRSLYTPVYIAEIRSRLLAKTALCPGFSTLLTNLFNTIKIEDLELGESLYNSINGIISDCGGCRLNQEYPISVPENPRKQSKAISEDTNQLEFDKISVFGIELSELEKGALNKMATIDETLLYNSFDTASQSGILTRDYIRGTHCELMEIPLPSHLEGMQFLQIASYIFENYSMICIGIAVEVREETKINKTDISNFEDDSANGELNSEIDESIIGNCNEDDEHYNFIITSEDDDYHPNTNHFNSEKNNPEKEDSPESSLNKDSTENENIDSERSNNKKLKLFPNKLKQPKIDEKIGGKYDFESPTCPKYDKKEESRVFGICKKKRILNPSDFISGRGWKYGDMTIEESTEISLLIISNSRRKVFSLIHEKDDLDKRTEKYKEPIIPRAKQTLNYIRLCLQGKTKLINNKLIIPSWRVETPITPRIRKKDTFGVNSNQLRGQPPSPIHREVKYSKISKIEKIDILCPSKIQGYIHGTTFILLVCEWPECLEEFLNGIVLNRSIPVGWESYRYSNRSFKTSVPTSAQSLILSTIIVFLSNDHNEKYLQKSIVPPGCIGVYIRGSSSNDEDLIRSGLFYAHSIVVCSSNSINSDSKVVTTCWRIHSLINMKIQAEFVLLKSKNSKYSNKACKIFKYQKKELSKPGRDGFESKYRDLKLFDAKWNMWQWKVTANLAQITKKWLFEGGHLPPCFFPAIIADIRFEESLPLLDNTSWISLNEWDFSTCPTVISGRVLTTDMIIPMVYRNVRINPLLATSDSMKPLLGYNEKYNFFNSPLTYDDQARNFDYPSSGIKRFYTAVSKIMPENDTFPDYTEWGSLELISVPQQFHGSNFSTLFKEMLRISGIITVGIVRIIGNNTDVPETVINQIKLDENNHMQANYSKLTNSYRPNLNRASPKFNINNRVLLLSPHPKHTISKNDLIYVVTPITKIF
ncbi:ion transport protein [Cryptosporidium ubiquitum]|uniref:Ion transport protein n=1 Tax=Cryptosporidium ubiquitum TaxID=857276 RepID=A0A1J4MA46_9CRYT|nr:ion transport protein [Cryptosporidium ubiquitum]OII70871.1 ion transport protein [Cryptosporidium ubiquitum]